MPCEHYKDALIEAASTGAAPQGELQAHLAECTSCREAFAQEQFVFAAIDSGLHTIANGEVPPSLLPRVRASLEEESVSSGSWFTNRLVLSSALVVVLSLLTVRMVWRTSPGQNPPDRTANANTAASVLPPTQTHNTTTGPSKEKDATSHNRPAIAVNRPAYEALDRGKNGPEVLVPRDQELLLASYARQVRERRAAPLVAASGDATTLAPLEVVPIQIAQLDVKLLTEEKSQ